MSWLLPSAFGVAAAASLITAALHFISRRRPIAEPLPTARFVPARAVHARVAARAFADPLLLALRTFAILLLGAAAAAPLARLSRGRVARVVVIDRSRAVASAAELRDSVRSVTRPGDVIVLADSAAARIQSPLDPASLVTTGVRGSLSAALAAGIAAAAGAAPTADSVQMILVSPLLLSEADAALAGIRATWPARIRVVPLRGALSDTVASAVAIRADANDALLAAASLDGLAARGEAESRAPIRLIRSEPDSADIAWARSAGHVLVQWPGDAPPPEWATRPAGSDSVSAVAIDGTALVGALRRPWRLPPLQPGQRVAARWIDGEPAAIETRFGAGCVRQVAVAFDERSDIALRQPFRRLLRSLVAPCDAAGPPAPLAEPSTLDMLRGDAAAPASAASSLLDAARPRRSPLAPWLLALGALLLIAEMAFRRSPRRKAV